MTFETFKEICSNKNNCLKELGTKNILIAGEENAKSLLWFSTAPDTDDNQHLYARGEKLEEFILEKGLIVCNKEGHLPTYVRLAQSQLGNNIDLTLCTPKTKIRNWRVHVETATTG